MKNKLLVYLMCVALVLTAILVSGCDGNVDVEAISITAANGVSEIEAGKTLQLTATVTPAEAPQEVTWSSSDSTKATVDGKGLVTAVAAGNVTITATSVANDKISKTFPLIIAVAAPVVDNTPKTVALTTADNATKVKVGETLKITATVSPAAASQEVVWSTNDSAIATVNNGVVTGVAAGTVAITATSKSVATVKNSINITVTAEEAEEPSDKYADMEFSTHEQYIAAAKNTELKVKGIVTYMNPEVDGMVCYYIQNGTEGFYIYKQETAKFSVELGKSYAVVGTKDVYNGTQELKNIAYCAELEEACTFAPVNLAGKDVSSLNDMNVYQGAVVTGTVKIKTTPTVGTSAYNIAVTADGKGTNLRVDPANMTAEEFAAINAKVATMVAGADVQFTGVMSAFGLGNAKPQIHIYKASEITVTEATPAEKVNIVKDALDVTAFVKADVETIQLVSGIDAVNDVTVTWASNNTSVITSLGAVTHPANDTVVTLTATITHKTETTATAQREFKVNVAGTAFAGQKVLELNFEVIKLEDNVDNNGNCKVKAGYQTKDKDGNATDALNTVKIGEDSWILNGALIGTEKGGDHCDGNFAARLNKYNDCKIQTTVAGEYNYVQFDAATYGSQQHGTVITVMYKMQDGEEWVESGIFITLNSYVLTTYRVALEAGVKDIRICSVKALSSVNIDNIVLYK